MRNKKGRVGEAQQMTWWQRSIPREHRTTAHEYYCCLLRIEAAAIDSKAV